MLTAEEGGTSEEREGESAGEASAEFEVFPAFSDGGTENGSGDDDDDE